jgi:long-chain acyl-CoA synthetase
MRASTRPSPTDHTDPHPSLASAFLARAAREPDRIALRSFETGAHLSFGEWSRRAASVAAGLAGLGVRPGDRVALLMGTRMEFHVVDMGALLLGAVPVSLYATSAVGQLEEILANADPRVLVVEEALAGKARALRERRPGLGRLVVVETGAARDGELSLAALEAAGAAAGFDPATAAAVTREDLATLVYTSGTTGPPKGVRFRHGALLAALGSMRQRFATTEADRAVSYLPMAHIAERIFGHYAAFVHGYEVTSLRDLAQLPAALAAVRPTRFFGVPRVYEKILAAVHAAIADAPDRDRVRAALAARVAAVRSGEPRPADPAAEALLRPYAELTGLDRAHFVAVAGAPSSPDMLEELTAIGLPINEFYGCSESIIGSCSPPGRVRLGTAGLPFPDVRIRLADDGEILVAGPTVTDGYFRDPGRTADAFDAGGWLRTGDIGRISADGYLRVVDRKKALIINSAGKNMSPANIEQAVKGGQPLLAQVIAVGDRRPYNVALIVLDPAYLHAFAREHGLTGTDLAALTRAPAVREAVAEAVRSGNEQLARVEQVKRYAVLDHDWPVGGEFLTPTAKLKRREIQSHYHRVIEDLYA